MSRKNRPPLPTIDSIYGPKNELIDFDYEEMALEEIKKEYPEANHTSFSGRYITGSDPFENRVFMDRQGEKIKGFWFPNILELTEKEFVDLLIKEARERLKDNDFSRFKEKAF